MCRFRRWRLGGPFAPKDGRRRSGFQFLSRPTRPAPGPACRRWPSGGEMSASCWRSPLPGGGRSPTSACSSMEIDAASAGRVSGRGSRRCCGAWPRNGPAMFLRITHQPSWLRRDRQPHPAVQQVQRGRAPANAGVPLRDTQDAQKARQRGTGRVWAGGVPVRPTATPPSLLAGARLTRRPVPAYDNNDWMNATGRPGSLARQTGSDTKQHPKPAGEPAAKKKGARRSRRNGDHTLNLDGKRRRR